MDIIKRDHIDYVGDAGNLPFLTDGCISEIYACHVLEHFNRNEIENVLTEWNRVLRKGGQLRLAVPDFEAIVEEYAKSKNMNIILGLLYGGQNYEYNFHYQTYDFIRMRELLESAGSGFKDIHKYNWHDFLPAGYDDYSRAYLPHMDFDNGRLMSLNILATKV